MRLYIGEGEPGVKGRYIQMSLDFRVDTGS